MNSSLILVGKVAGTAALATGALVTGVTTSHSPSSTSDSSSSATTQKAHCGNGLRVGKAPAALKTALTAARAEPAGKERREALQTIRKDARKGEYGDATQVASLRRTIAQLHLRAQAPDALKSALKAAKAKPAGDERKAAFAAVQKDAAAGTYGAKVEKIAKKRAANKSACQAKRAEHKTKKQQSSASPSPSTSEDSTS